MNIVYITPVFPPYRAGISRVAFLYAQWAHDAGHHVEVFTPEYGRAHGDFEFRVQHVNPFFVYGNAAIMGTYRVLREPDVIHVHYPFIGGLWAAHRLRKRFPSARLVVTYHMDLIGGGVKGLLFWAWRQWGCRFIIRNADVIHVTSRDYFEHCQLARYVSKDDKRVRDVALSVKNECFDVPDRHECRQLISENTDTFLVLMVASLDNAHRFKGVAKAIDALCVLNTKSVHARLCVIGEGECLEEYRQYAVAVGVGDQVRFVGSVADDQLRLWYGAADVCIAPSVSGSEAFGLILIEAQAAQTPVIASSLPGVRTVFVPDKTGLLVSPEDHQQLAAALFRLVCLTDDEYAEWARLARVNALQYHPDRIRDIVLSLYK